MRKPARCDRHHIYTLIVGTVLMRLLVRWWWRVRVRKARGVDAQACLLACNHRSFLDPPLATMFLDRPVSYLARSSLWKLPVVGQMLWLSRGIPIDRDEPQLQIMKRCVARLREGTGLLVFPEGTRTRTGRLGRLRDGPALFARRAGVPVVPVYVHGTDRVWPRGVLLPRPGGARVEVRIGRPRRPPACLPTKLQDRWVMEYLRRWLLRQEAALRGPPERIGM